MYHSQGYSNESENSHPTGTRLDIRNLKHRALNESRNDDQAVWIQVADVIYQWCSSRRFIFRRSDTSTFFQNNMFPTKRVGKLASRAPCPSGSSME